MSNRPPGVVKSIFEPYYTCFAAVIVGFWPEAVWRSTIGWIVTAIWLIILTVAWIATINKRR